MSGNTGSESVYESLRLSNCNFCKAVLMLIIVLYHSGIFGGGGYNAVSQGDSLGVFLRWLATFHNYAFVLISGYIYCFIKLEKKGYNSYRNFIAKKAKRLIIPFFVVGYIWVFPIRGLYLGYTAEQFIRNFVFGINPGQLWFLFMLFWVFVFAHFIFRRFGNNMIYTGIVILIHYAGMVIGNYLPNVFQLFTAMQYLPYFFVGFCLRKYGATLRKKEVYILIAALILNIGIFAITQTIQHKGIQGTMMTLFGYPLMRLAGAVMAFIILDRLANVVPWNNKLGLFLCEASFPVYLFHEQIIYFLVPYLRDIFNPVWTMLSIFVTALLITCLLSRFLMKRRVARTAIGLA